MRTWSQRVTDIEATGWSLTKIARHIGLNPPAVSDIKTGRTIEPKGMPAVELYKLHRKRCKELANE